MSNKKNAKLRNNFQKLEIIRRQLIKIILAKTDFIEGNLSKIKVRCGQPGCHCRKKPAHLVTRLGIYEDGKIKNKVVRINDRDKVGKLVQLYKNFKKTTQELKQIEEKEKEIIKQIRKLRHWPYK